MYRVAQHKVLIRPDAPVLQQGADGLMGAQLPTGLWVPAATATRDKAQEGVATVAGARTGIPEGARVLYNKWAAREIDDEYVVARDTDVLAYRVAAGPWQVRETYFAVRPLPQTELESPSAVLLTEKYLSAMNRGVDLDSLAVQQVGVAEVMALGPDVWSGVHIGDWVIFEYRRAIYQPHADGEWVWVCDDGQTLIAGMPAEMVEELR